MRSITVLALVPALASAACPLAAQSASRPAVSLVASNFSVGGLPPPLYFRHAGFQGWATPDETNLDDLDSSFVLSPGLVTGDPSGTVSFQNADEYPGYFIVVSEAVDNRVILSPADGSAFFNATASWYPRDAPGPDGACLLESFAVPGLFMTATVPPADGRAPTDTPCHYASCAPVFALPPNASLAAGAVWLPVPANSGPGSNATDGPFTVGGITFTLRNATQTIAGLSAAGDADAFEWLPSDTGRIGPGFQHLGDATLRLRPAAADPATPWTQVATGAAPSHARAVPVPPSLPGGLIAADVTPLLAAGAPGGAASLLGLRVVREYGTANASSGGLALSFILSNTNATSALELGAFGASLPFDNDWTGLSLEQNAATCSLADPYVGLDAGYVRVTRISGRGPVILVTPLPRAESDCAVAGVPAAGGCIGRLEAWRKLTEDPAPRRCVRVGWGGRDSGTPSHLLLAACLSRDSTSGSRSASRGRRRCGFADGTGAGRAPGPLQPPPPTADAAYCRSGQLRSPGTSRRLSCCRRAPPPSSPCASPPRCRPRASPPPCARSRLRCGRWAWRPCGGHRGSCSLRPCGPPGSS